MFSRILHTLGEKSTRMRFSILYLSTDVSSVMGKPRHTAGSRQEGYFALPLLPILYQASRVDIAEWAILDYSQFCKKKKKKNPEKLYAVHK